MNPGFVFVYPERVHLLWLACLLLGFLVWRETRGGDILARFVSLALQPTLTVKPSQTRRFVRLGCIGLTLVLTILALMRPQMTKPTAVHQASYAADIMVVLDVSKSMLAEDAAPNRLERAKAEIRDLVLALDGNRFGLVAFAGRAQILCPLTTDYGFFRLVLDGANTRSITRGGTRIGDGLRAALKAYPAGLGSRLLLLVTDGEDHDSYPLEAAKQAAEAGVHIVSVGFGSEKGSEITSTDPQTGARQTLKDHDGQAVLSKLDGETLRKLALETQGVYVPAGTAALDLKSIVEKHIVPLVVGKEAAASTTRLVHEERYAWFLFAALGALFGAVISSRPGSVSS